jgi:hypothetical protein
MAKVPDQLKSGLAGIIPGEKKSASKNNAESSPAKSNSSYTGKYNIDHLTYPADLFDTAKPASPYVLFMINDYVLPQSTQKEEYLAEQPKREHRGGFSRMGVDPGALKVTTSVMGSATLVGLAQGLLGVPKGGIATAVETTLGTGALMAAYSGLDFSKPQKRLKKAIALHMPNNLTTSYSSNYSDISSANTLAATTILGDIVGGVKTGSDKLDDLINTFKTGDMADVAAQAGSDVRAARQGAKDEGKKITDVMRNMAMAQLPGGKQISAATGLAANPRIQAVFESVKPREFGMHYTFFPKSEGELNDIHNIIKTFKKHMLPSYKSEDEWLFVYPSEFDIEYWIGNEQNPYVHKHTSCVLLDMAINYTPDGTYSHFGNGASTKIEISLMFREVDIVTRKDAEEGF